MYVLELVRAKMTPLSSEVCLDVFEMFDDIRNLFALLFFLVAYLHVRLANLFKLLLFPNWVKFVLFYHGHMSQAFFSCLGRKFQRPKASIHFQKFV